jgi:hypothetical protein
MLHVVEIDQSGKIEDTKEDTVLALSNGMQYAILIPATVKRACITRLRQSGAHGKTFYLRLFAVALYFLLRDHIAMLSHAIIDIEYTGQDALIKRYVMNLLQRSGRGVDASQLRFMLVGKRSAAHTVAWRTLRGKRKPDKILSLEEMLGEFSPQKKSGATSR